MADADVQFQGKTMRLPCFDGNEARLQKLVDAFCARVDQTRAKNNKLSNDDAIVIAAIDILAAYDGMKNRFSSLSPDDAAAEYVAARLDAASEKLEKVLAAAG